MSRETKIIVPEAKFSGEHVRCHIEGVIVDFKICSDASESLGYTWSQLYLEYEDGHVQSFRYNNHDQPTFKLNVPGRTHFSTSYPNVFRWGCFEEMR